MVHNHYTAMLALALSFALAACVTQNFENGETQVIQNQSSRDDMAATRISLGLGYLKMGNMPQAKQNLEKAKKFAPDMVQVYTAFAHYYETVGEHTLTIESYEQALSLKSDDADTLNNYGVYLCRQDQLEAAEEQLLKAIAVPSYLLVAKSYENLSSCFLQEDNFLKAETYLSKAILHSSSSASTLFQMVQLQYAKADYQQAKYFQQRFEKVTRRFTPQSLALAYKVYSKLGQHSTAKNYGTMLVKMYPQSWESQQYVLNELELIEADNLAKRYQVTQIKTQQSKPKKRIVKLSPKANSAPKANPTRLAAEPSTPPLNVEPLIIPTSATASQASVQMVSDALSMTASPVDKAITIVVAEEKPAAIIEAPAIAAVEVKSAKTKTAELEKAVEDALKMPIVPKPAVHIVNKGDTLYSISMQYNVKISALQRWNELSKKRKIRINDKLFVENPAVGDQK